MASKGVFVAGYQTVLINFIFSTALLADSIFFLTHGLLPFFSRRLLLWPRVVFQFWQQGHDILNAPQPIRYASRHHWRNPERVVATNKVVVHEVYADRSAVISIFFENALVSLVNLRMQILMVR